MRTGDSRPTLGAGLPLHQLAVERSRGQTGSSNVPRGTLMGDGSSADCVLECSTWNIPSMARGREGMALVEMLSRSRPSALISIAIPNLVVH